MLYVDIYSYTFLYGFLNIFYATCFNKEYIIWGVLRMGWR